MFLFQDPTWLWGLLAVGAAAVWALYRPQRQLAVVGSLELWQSAVEHMDRSQRPRARRVTLSWLLLLAGALAAVAAAARPVFLSSAPARSVAIALYPSAEIASKTGVDGLRRAAGQLLDRLSSGDRVQLLLPEGEPGTSAWMSVDAARRRIRSLPALPVPAAEFALPAPDKAAQHLYRIAPAGSSTHLAPGETLIKVPAALPEVTFDALAAETLPDGNVQVFISLYNHVPSSWRGGLRISIGRPGSAEQAGGTLQSVMAPPGRSVVVLPAKADPSLVVEIVGGGGIVGWGGYLARRESAIVRVAFVGDDDPLIRRFVTINPDLSLLEDPADADVLVCVGRDPPGSGGSPGAGKPALVIRPPSPPPGCREAGRLANLVLGEAGLSVDSQDPVMRDTDLSAVAVRSASPWTPDRAADLRTLCGVKGAALIVRTAPELGPAEAGEARRIYLAFGTDTENTNFGTTESFVIFLANAFDWLGEDARGAGLPARPGRIHYEFVSPQQAAFTSDWKRLGPAPNPDEPAWAEGPYPPPGLYQDGRGDLHAVSLVGLRSGIPKTPTEQAVAAAPLPPARATGTSFELWTWLALAAILLWLTGWAARMR